MFGPKGVAVGGLPLCGKFKIYSMKSSHYKVSTQENNTLQAHRI